MPALVDPNAPPDIIEGYAWGREWAMGTYKHPPLQAWLLELFAFLTHRAAWTHLFLTQAMVVVAFWSAWDLGRRMMSEKAALVGVLILEGVAFYNIDSAQYNPFNPNILQMALWGLMTRSFYLALKEDKTKDWLWLSLWSACAFYGKYSVVLLLASFGLLMLFTPQGRVQLRSKNPYLSAAIVLVLFAPHIVWLVQNDFLPFVYASGRFERPLHEPYFLMAPYNFIHDQFLRVLPAAVIFAMTFGAGFVRKDKVKKENIDAFDRLFLDYVFLTPFAVVLFLAAATGHNISVLWSTSFWNLAGLWTIARLKPSFTQNAQKRLTALLLIVLVVEGAGYAYAASYYPLHKHAPRRVDFPGRVLAEKIHEAWHAHYQAPLAYVVGTAWTAGNVSFYGADRPHVLINGDYTENPTIKPADLARDGGIVVWCIENCHDRVDAGQVKSIKEQFPMAQEQEPIIVPWQTQTEVAPLHIGWALLPPVKAE